MATVVMILAYVPWWKQEYLYSCYTTSILHLYYMVTDVCPSSVFKELLSTVLVLTDISISSHLYKNGIIRLTHLCQACGHDAFFCLLMKIGHLFYVWIYGSSSRNCTFIAFKWPSVSWGRRPFTSLGPDASGRVIKANTAASVIKLKAG